MDLAWEGTLVQWLDLSSDLDSAEKFGVIVGFSDDGRVWEVIGAAVGSGLGGEVGVTVYDPVHVTCSIDSIEQKFFCSVCNCFNF